MDINKALTILKEEHYELSTLEQFTNTYVIVKELKKFIEGIEAKAKKKGFQLMAESDTSKIDVGEYSIVKQDPSESKEYKASNIIKAFGLERAIPFLKVNKKSLDFYLTSGYKSGAVSPEEMEQCQKSMFSKMRKGYIKLVKKQ